MLSSFRLLSNCYLNPPGSAGQCVKIVIFNDAPLKSAISLCNCIPISVLLISYIRTWHLLIAILKLSLRLAATSLKVVSKWPTFYYRQII